MDRIHYNSLDHGFLYLHNTNYFVYLVSLILNHFSQPLLILIATSVPLVCLYFKRWHWLAAWLGLAATINIFDSQKYMNLTAIKIAGLVSLPFLVLKVNVLWKSHGFRVLLALIFYLSILGIWFGHLFPWIDPTGLKSGRDLPQWRSVIHLGSLGLEYSASLMLAICFQLENRSISWVFRTILIGAFLSIMAGFGEGYWSFDFYKYFTTAAQTYQELIEGRARGFNYEPRGLAQTCVYGALILLVSYRRRPILMGIGLLIMLVGATIVTYSASSVFLLAVGVFLVLVFELFFRVMNKNFNKSSFAVVVAVVGLLLASCVLIKLNNSASRQLADRSFVISGERIVDKLEVFDAASVNFLNNNPLYYLTGVGPGLISLPASAYILEKETDWKTGFSAMPHMGIIAHLSSGGVIGLFLWILLVLICARALFDKVTTKRLDHYCLTIFAIGMTLYLLQIHALYYIFLALGFYATLPGPNISPTSPRKF